MVLVKDSTQVLFFFEVFRWTFKTTVTCIEKR